MAAVEAPKSFERGRRRARLPLRRFTDHLARAGRGAAHRVEQYVPTTWPGARLPHVWIRPGELRCTTVSPTATRCCGSVARERMPRRWRDAFDCARRAASACSISAQRHRARSLRLRLSRGASGPARGLARQFATGRSGKARAYCDGALASRNNESEAGRTEMKPMRTVALATSLRLQCWSAPASAQSVADFYKGKTIQMHDRVRSPAAPTTLYAPRASPSTSGATFPGNPQSRVDEHGGRRQPARRQLALQRRAEGRHRARRPRAARRRLRRCSATPGGTSFDGFEVHLDRQRQQRGQSTCIAWHTTAVKIVRSVAQTRELIIGGDGAERRRRAVRARDERSVRHQDQDRQRLSRRQRDQSRGRARRGQRPLRLVVVGHQGRAPCTG